MLKRFLKKGCIKNNQGFSLVELIVVIAIMAVMAAVLAPALLGYVEKSRMQKDDSAMDEVVNAMQLSLADQDVYDEVVEHSVWDNVSCYIDARQENGFTQHKIILKEASDGKAEQYLFGDEARQLDETVYFAAGNMRGMTITFSPGIIGENTYDLQNGVLNKFVGRKTGYLKENPELYNMVRSTIGDTLETTSQTYRNSDYTIFIRVGSTGGSEAVQQDAIQVWGQFNGTNLAERDHRYEISAGRVVGEDGRDDALKNKYKNDYESDFDFGENPIKRMQLTINGEKVVIQYESDMTWREWFESDYNTTELKIATGSSGRQYLITDETCQNPNCKCKNYSYGTSDGINSRTMLLTWGGYIPNKDINVKESLFYSNCWANLDQQILHPATGYNTDRFDEDYSDFVSYRIACGDTDSFGIEFSNAKEWWYE